MLILNTIDIMSANDAIKRQWFRPRFVSSTWPVQYQAFAFIRVVTYCSVFLSTVSKGIHLGGILIKGNFPEKNAFENKVSDGRPSGFRPEFLNSLWPNDAIQRRRSELTLVQVMTCCLMAPGHFRRECWCFIWAQWHTPEGNFNENAQDINHQDINHRTAL